MDQVLLGLIELKTSVNGRLEQIEKRQDTYDKREEERRKSEEAARQAQPDRAWGKANVVGVYLAIAASIILSISLHFWR
jgi:hypothetical protein